MLYHSQSIHAQGQVPKIKYREFSNRETGSPFVVLEFVFKGSGCSISIMFATVEEARLVGQHILNVTEPFVKPQFVDPAMA